MWLICHSQCRAVSHYSVVSDSRTNNSIIELDNLELPILDGSARPFVELIRKAGIRKQRRPRTYVRILRALEVREGNKFIGIYPADTYSVSYTINFPHPMIGREAFTL